MAATITEESVKIPPAGLAGDLAMPPNATGIVVFAHGSGSSRHSRRNRYVARVLNQAGLATLLMDLLTIEEEEIDLETRELRFDINLLTRRLGEATEWLRSERSTESLSIGYFGASTGAAAALAAAAAEPQAVRAVVSRGGRVDLAGRALVEVQAPTLLIVGSEDEWVLERNRESIAVMRCEKALRIVTGATHLFEEPGTLEEVARLAADWFGRYLPDHTDQRR
jgi:putative phosphoribosyl transferase